MVNPFIKIEDRIRLRPILLHHGYQCSGTIWLVAMNGHLDHNGNYYEMDEQNRHYWNKVILEKRSKYLIGKIVHHSGRTIVSASTNEPSIAVFLGTKSTYTDVKAAKILGQVLAMRSLESGIHSVFYDYREQRKSGEKLSSFIDALKQNGLNLDEQPVIFARAQRDQ